MCTSAPLLLCVRRCTESVTSRSRKNRAGVAVAGEGRVVDVPKFHSWGKSTMPSTNINWDWEFNAFSGLCITLWGVIIAGPLRCILGYNVCARQLLYFDQLVTFVPPNHACSIGAASAFADERLSDVVWCCSRDVWGGACIAHAQCSMALVWQLSRTH